MYLNSTFKYLKFSIAGPVVFLLISSPAFSQTIRGRVMADGQPISLASIFLAENGKGIATDSAGYFKLENVKPGSYTLKSSATGFRPYTRRVTITGNTPVTVNITLQQDVTKLNDVVVTGTLRPVSRAESPIPVEVYTPKYFQKNPSPSLFESIGMVNGVRPQLNCNVCNTGDIHINGMEGPYTMVLIDGMPIVSSLSTVYGLNGIPISMVERIEVVKGPGSSLYGSEAMGGLINVITKNPATAPVVSLDAFGTSWQEYNVDAAVKLKAGSAQSIVGVNYFNYQHPLDKNHDGFTDVTLQQRISVFNKWGFQRRDNRVASLAARYVYEDRWGGDMKWSRQWRGSDSIYGESIYTKRLELIGMYQLPVKEKIMLQFSYNRHNQNSYYGHTPFMADQNVTFAQAYWDKQLGEKHSLLAGASFRYTYYDDNTPGTLGADGKVNEPMKTPLPGIFVQDEWVFAPKHKLLLGYRYDYDKHHGNIHSPRIAYKWTPNTDHTVRASFGTGFRVVNLFTEEHAALTGSREVVVAEALKPEKSYNANLNYVWKITMDNAFINIDATGFYSYFTNKITGDFDTDPNKIIYDNLRGHAVSRGISLNTDFAFSFPLKIMTGISYMDVYQVEDNAVGVSQKSIQLNAPAWSGTFVIGYSLPAGFSADLTGNWNGPMRLPVQHNDYRPDYSPWFMLANIQLTKKFPKGWEVYGGVKNLLNYVPKYALMRPFDPFDKHVNDPVNNPNGYTFDTEYNYAPLQGIRGFLGVRYNLFR
ncbi:TonB-dependent receptor [Chitinophaga tropicalis]|uniref:TonB-dependent receptor plug domain-containing protein n=1 Tax=Chitinophaga tropicalis TaxID=2683588 RepID=A0A7K1U5D9_9BACT|nr:TonB-dependent receptor [Chitinophaga tropicalis]MVT09582.1 TonB-dependent receptor plug domain-containing protein [Chitinophaga tropicalis]